jgi:amino acid transporter
MASARKFGTFSGVFTPSILTILGVIMYLRLPAIVGQGGLATALLVIVVAHVISVTTGLSVASVATDRKVRGGGTYYMLSRSLGLPIGGTLGIALFVGLSFAVSLYIIGFAESFLGFWGIDAGINGIRLVGVAVLLLVTGVTLVSTSLALRSQFFILAAIALSLVSIFLGVGRHELAPGSLATVPEALPAALPFIVLFGIFFPAVTGFEAGVSMSGDLRDPKRSIPIGTIAAIVVGLLVYIGLAVFLALTVDAGVLMSSPSVLLDISVAPPLVLAGVWGATISSALGSVLAAPRILQATAVDRITPVVFGRGFGPDNEPRVALLLTFVIALVGILIGELDVIARIVSMFFITAYGFLNLSCAIESWASPDFRPSFRVPRIVPVIGALACLVVMIQLDFLAMIGATVVLGALFFFLTRRQLQLDTGDAWSGFWAAVARAALHRLDRGAQHRRNWRPNLLAFALPGSPRDEVMSLASQLAGRRGMLTGVDILPGADGGAVGRGGAVDVDGGVAYGTFARTVRTADPHRSVLEMARHHGFAGVEPNTLLLPWPARPDEHFGELVAQLAGIDRNLLLLAPAAPRAAAAGVPARTTGRRPLIDVWWWGEPDHALLQLSMLRALSSHDAWRLARVRVQTVDTAAPTGVQRRMTAVLEDMRIDAEVRIARNTVPAGPEADVVARESEAVDLVLVDASVFAGAGRAPDMQRIDELRSRMAGAVVFMLPAASFGGVAPPAPRRAQRAAEPAGATDVPARRALPDVKLPADATLAAAVTVVHDALTAAADAAITGPLAEANARTRTLLVAAQQLVNESLASAAEAVAGGQAAVRTDRAMRKLHGDTLYQARVLIERQRQHALPEQAAAVTDFADRLLHDLETLADTFDEELTIHLGRAEFAAVTDDDARLRAYKLWKRITSPRSERIAVRVPLRELARRRLIEAVPVVERAQREFVETTTGATADVQALLAGGRDALERVHAAAGTVNASSIAAHERQRLADEAGAMIARHDASVARVRDGAARAIRQVLQRLARDAARVDASRRTRISRQRGRDAAASAERGRSLPETWRAAQELLLEGAELELTMLALRNRIATIMARAATGLRLQIQNGMIARLKDVRGAIEEYVSTADENPGAVFTRIFESWPVFAVDAVVDELRTELREPSEALPERVETLSAAAAGRLSAGEMDDVEIVSIALRPLVDYHIDAELLGPLQERLAQVPGVYARVSDAAQDAVRLAAFRLRDADTRDEPAGGGELLMGDAVQRIDAGIAELERLVADLDEHIAARLGRALEGLEPHRLMRETGRLPQYIRARRGREALTWFEQQRIGAQRFANEQAVRLLYQRSEAVRFARELEHRGRARSALFDLVAAVSPEPQVLERLPYHYRQLFLGKPGFSREFRAGWAVERRLAARAVSLYNRGFEGAILVLGEPFAGKSALVHGIADEHFNGATVHRVVPPRERVTTADALLDAVSEAVGVPPGSDDPLVAAATGSIMIFDDLDGWWERHHDGYHAIDAAVSLMERHAGRLVFLASADAHAYRFIDRAHDIGRHFLATIECRPFSAREISDVVQLRHASTGFVFELDGVGEDDLAGTVRARLFNRLFDYSGGNIGAALHGWIAGITAVNGDRLTVRRPVAPDLSALDELEAVHRLLLVQLLLHRSMEPDRLVRLGGARPAIVAGPLAELRRARVIVEDLHGMLVINPYLRPFVARRFAELELVE